MRTGYKIAAPIAAAAAFLLCLFMVANEHSTCMEASPATTPRSSGTVLGTTLEYRK